MRWKMSKSRVYRLDVRWASCPYSPQCILGRLRIEELDPHMYCSYLHLQVCRRLHTEESTHIRQSSCRTAVIIRYITNNMSRGIMIDKTKTNKD